MEESRETLPGTPQGLRETVSGEFRRGTTVRVTDPTQGRGPEKTGPSHCTLTVEVTIVEVYDVAGEHGGRAGRQSRHHLPGK